MKRAVLILLPLFGVVMFLVLKEILPFVLKYLYSCKFKEVTGYWCPGCGNTRFVIFLMNGQILKAIKCNYGTVFIILSLFVLYIEKLLLYFGINKKLLPRGKVFWITALVLIMIYYIARNFVAFLAIPNI